MLTFPDGPRKRRTRQHIIADQSVNHVERVIIDAGHVAQRVHCDYGYDLVVMTFDEHGYAEPGQLFLQLKGTEKLVARGENYSFDLDVRDYNLWKDESQPVLLVLFCATTRRAYWLHTQDHFAAPAHRPRSGAKTVRVSVPKRHSFSVRAVARLRVLKNGRILNAVGGES